MTTTRSGEAIGRFVWWLAVVGGCGRRNVAFSDQIGFNAA